jgi:hypothetical protein
VIGPAARLNLRNGRGERMLAVLLPNPRLVPHAKRYADTPD